MVRARRCGHGQRAHCRKPLTALRPGASVAPDRARPGLGSGIACRKLEGASGTPPVGCTVPPSAARLGQPASDSMRDVWRIVVLDLPSFGPRYVWLTISRHEPAEVVDRYRRSATPEGVTVTAGGGVASSQSPPSRRLHRREAQRMCDELGVQLNTAGFRVLSDAARMARIRRLAREARTGCPRENRGEGTRS